MPVRTEEEYVKVIQKLLPPGEYWDRQLSDPESDISRWCQVKAVELRRFKLRCSGLLNESFPGQTTELIDEWERALDSINPDLPLDLRRKQLAKSHVGYVNLTTLNATAALYNAEVLAVQVPFRPAFFGHSKFPSRMWQPSCFIVVYVTVLAPNIAVRPAIETALTKELLANSVIHFIYQEVP